MRFFIVVSLLLSGCVTSYAPPNNPIHPAIRLDMKNINSVFFFEKGEDCSRSAKLEKPHNPYLADALPLPVRGNELLAFQLAYSNRRESCGVTISFLPRFNYDYVIYNKLKLDQRSNISCDFKVIRKYRNRQSAQWQNEETVRKRRQVKAIKPDERHCR